MIRTRTGRVTALGRAWQGCQELDVVLDGAPGADPARALAYPALVGAPEVGDAVVLNTTAVALGLGTGGHHLVIAVLGRAPEDHRAGAGHLVKARYTPLQATVLGVDEADSPHRAAMAAATGLDGMPVVLADLHSALPAIVAGVRAERPDARVAYVMTDGGALPLWYSRTVAGLAAAGWLAGSVTTGQSFGGDLEAVTLHAGLLAARAVLHADVAVVTQGPGNLGTGLPWSFSGVAVGEAVNAAALLGGRPVASLRISQADPRERHRGVSHHSLLAYGQVATAEADVVVPRWAGLVPDGLVARVDADVAALAGRHRRVDVAVDGLREALVASPVPLRTMGRDLDTELGYFLAAAAAGRHAARLAG
ncbi:MAG: hypothetical protein JWM48_2195 [Mycobacterium sp.]|nr:hypothetical protein [Mycobacterium sp.]